VFGQVFTSGVHLWCSCRTRSVLVMISLFANIFLPLTLYLVYDLSGHRGFPCPKCQMEICLFFRLASGRAKICLFFDRLEWVGPPGPVLFYGPPPLIVIFCPSVCPCVRTGVHLRCSPPVFTSGVCAEHDRCSL
jgi:hypothetical protein